MRKDAVMVGLPVPIPERVRGLSHVAATKFTSPFRFHSSIVEQVGRD
jgi:hypothetical protein